MRNIFKTALAVIVFGLAFCVSLPASAQATTGPERLFTEDVKPERLEELRSMWVRYGVIKDGKISVDALADMVWGSGRVVIPPLPTAAMTKELHREAFRERNRAFSNIAFIDEKEFVEIVNGEGIFHPMLSREEVSLRNKEDTDARIAAVPAKFEQSVASVRSEVSSILSGFGKEVQTAVNDSLVVPLQEIAAAKKEVTDASKEVSAAIADQSDRIQGLEDIQKEIPGNILALDERVTAGNSFVTKSVVVGLLVVIILAAIAIYALLRVFGVEKDVKLLARKVKEEIVPSATMLESRVSVLEEKTDFIRLLSFPPRMDYEMRQLKIGEVMVPSRIMVDGQPVYLRFTGSKEGHVTVEGIKDVGPKQALSIDKVVSTIKRAAYNERLEGCTLSVREKSKIEKEDQEFGSAVTMIRPAVVGS